ncbi:MAG: hypothetical protein ACLQJR_08120 [Stellaceae bacterium]
MGSLAAVDKGRLKLIVALFPLARYLGEPAGWTEELAPGARQALAGLGRELEDLLLLLCRTPKARERAEFMCAAPTRLSMALHLASVALAADAAEKVRAGRYGDVRDNLRLFNDLLRDALEDGAAAEIVAIVPAVDATFYGLRGAIDKLSTVSFAGQLPSESSAVSEFVDRLQRDLPALFDSIAEALVSGLARIYERWYGRSMVVER